MALRRAHDLTRKDAPELDRIGIEELNRKAPQHLSLLALLLAWLIAALGDPSPPSDCAGIVLDKKAAVLSRLQLPPKTKLLALPFILRSSCFYYIAPTPILLSISSSIVRAVCKCVYVTANGAVGGAPLSRTCNRKLL